MHLSLSPEEFARLLLLASVGEIVVNDWTPPEEMDNERRAAGDLLGDLLARAEGSPVEAMLTRDPETGEWIPGDLLRDKIDDYVGAYDNEVFWDELVHRFARRDLQSEYGQESIGAMPEAYRTRAEAPMLEYWWKEVREHGVSRLQVQDEAAERSARRRQERGTRKREKPGAAEEGETAA